MSTLEHYDVELNGRRTVLRLSAEDAKRRGYTAKDKLKAAPAAVEPDSTGGPDAGGPTGAPVKTK